MEFNLSNYTDLLQTTFDYASIIAAVIFAFLKQYHSRKQKKAEAEAASQQAKVRELEVKHLLKKREIEELRKKLETSKSKLENEEKLRKKYEDRYNKLKIYLKIDNEFN